MAFVHKEVVIAELYNLFPSMPIFGRRKWEEKNAQYLECIRAVEKIPEVDKDYNKLIEHIEARREMACHYAEYETGKANIRLEGMAQGMTVAAMIIRKFYEEI